MQLSAEQARVLGSLVEKQLTTPQQYPLTLISLVAACNQSTNRDPVVDYSEELVTSAIDDLKRLRLARSVLPSHGRSAVRFRHVLDETLALDTRQCALLCVLLLRGPQTMGELRIRTERMASFDGLAEVEHELDFLGSREQALATNIGRQPGQKEERWATPLVAPPAAVSAVSSETGATGGGGWNDDSDTGPGGERDRSPADGLGALRTDLAALQSEVSELRRDLADLRASLGE